MDALRIASYLGGRRTSRLCVVVAVVICLVPASLAARAVAEIQLWPENAGGTFGSLLPTSGRASLLDPSKLDISHQMVFAYSSGRAGSSNVGGLWRTNFSYKFSNPLTVDVAVGAALSKMGPRELDAQNLFLESFSLRYRPSENLYLHFMYREAPGSWFMRPEYLTR